MDPRDPENDSSSPSPSAPSPLPAEPAPIPAGTATYLDKVVMFVEELSQLRYCRSRESCVGAFVGTEAGYRTIKGLRKELVALGMNVGL